ncbi:MAG: DNA polymerase III subunit chi [Candidatus Nitrotoga sp.]
MTKVDFYTGVEDKLRTACKLSHKAVESGMRVQLYSPDEATTQTLDALLWSYPTTAFLPHCRNDEEGAGDIPVVLAHAPKNSTASINSVPDENFVHSKNFPHNEVLISLHSTCLPFFSRFERVIEIVGLDATDIHTGRERFSFYRDRGYEMRHFDLRSQLAQKRAIHPKVVQMYLNQKK